MVAKRKRIEQDNRVVKRSSIKQTCNVGFCGDEERLNACRFKRRISTPVDKITFGPVRPDNTTFYNETLSKRLFFQRLFQQKNNWTNIELQDISIHLK
ncbi:12066_t:CDS:1, partial [Gigaspora margarita]